MTEAVTTIYVGVDPGESTGIVNQQGKGATLNFDDAVVRLFAYCIGVQTSPVPAKLVFVVEDFTPYLSFHNVNAKTPMELIGFIKGLAVIYEATIVLQQPFVKQMGCPEIVPRKKCYSIHMKDAAKHLDVYFYTNKIEPCMK